MPLSIGPRRYPFSIGIRLILPQYRSSIRTVTTPLSCGEAARETTERDAIPLDHCIRRMPNGRPENRAGPILNSHVINLLVCPRCRGTGTISPASPSGTAVVPAGHRLI